MQLILDLDVGCTHNSVLAIDDAILRTRGRGSSAIRMDICAHGFHHESVIVIGNARGARGSAQLRAESRRAFVASWRSAVGWVRRAVEAGEEVGEHSSEHGPKCGHGGGDNSEVALDRGDGPTDRIVDIFRTEALVELVEPVDQEDEADARDDGDA